MATLLIGLVAGSLAGLVMLPLMRMVIHRRDIAALTDTPPRMGE